MAFGLNTRYYQLPGFQPEPVFGTIVEMLLKTRLRLHLEATEALSDEDVNAYLAGLLVSYVDPGYVNTVSRVVSPYDVDVFQLAEKTQDHYRAYWIYKVNADDLLLSLGIFRKLWQEEKGEVIRMKRYYAHASEYHRRIYGKPTALGEIHTKLAAGSERYLTILSNTRREYFSLLDQMQSEEIAALSLNLRQYEAEVSIKAAEDEFLDLYSSWLKGSHEPALLQRMLELAGLIQDRDPSFHTDSLMSQLKVA